MESQRWVAIMDMEERMSSLSITDFYPRRFSLWLDAFVWLAVFLGGLAFASDYLPEQWMPAWVWGGCSAVIYAIVGFRYAARRYPHFNDGERAYNWTWIGCINMALPFFLVLVISTLLWLAGAITFLTASCLAIGALVTAVLGPLLLGFAVVVFVLSFIWRDSRASAE